MFSEQLKVELKRLYPLDVRLQELAECNSPYLVNYLKDSWGGFSAQEILEATSLDNLKEKALLIKQKMELYSLCVKENESS